MPIKNDFIHNINVSFNFIIGPHLFCLITPEPAIAILNNNEMDVSKKNNNNYEIVYLMVTRK